MLNTASHLVLLFENATEGIILTDGAGNIVIMNPAAQRMFGYLENELTGKSIETLIPEKFRQGHVSQRAGFSKKPSNRAMGQNRNLFGRKKDGSELPIEVSLSHYKQEDELYVIAFIVDITKRKEIEANMERQQKELEKVSSEIRKLNADLEAKVEERTIILKEALQQLEQSQLELSDALEKEKQLGEIKSRFLSMASHEFRTPLSTVLSSASLLSKYKKEEEQEKRERHIDKIKNSVKHLNDLLEDFLSLGKLDEGKVTTSCVEVNVKDLISETVDEMNGLTKENQQIVYQHHGAELAVTDNKLLKNVLINLMTNAIKFSAADTTIDVYSFCNAENIKVSITDRGIGISKDDQPHLLSSFFRGANATNIQGTGLGLHIVQRYLSLLGGEVQFESELNKGTTVTFTIPVNQQA
ncbi:MAG TPA: PAS domain-containing sensor histidine kinase [Chitinophagaceae bacterium]|jgi:PAS domain S-box-containing protein|nr:PAS domain-containing sensor histidine kinase [Chitinophagaceae bacterium]